MTKLHVKGDYAKRRAKEYPEIGEQLDAIWSALATLPKKDLPVEAAGMLEKIAAVKAKYPKS